MQHIEGSRRPSDAPGVSFGGDRPLSAEAASALRQAWLRNRETALAGHTGQVQLAAFSPDGTRVVTASWDKTARVWDLSGARPVATVLEGHTNGVQSAAFRPDGRQVLTFEGAVRRWVVYPDIAELSAFVISRLSRCLTTAQRDRFGVKVIDFDRPRDLVTAPGPDGRCAH